MDFLIGIRGSHSEGHEGKVRFDKLVADFAESLTSAGFIPKDVYGNHDEQATTTEATAADVESDLTIRPAYDTVPPAEVLAASLSVPFASAPAAKLADKKDLTDRHFDGVKPSGETGYTVDDVKAIIKALS